MPRSRFCFFFILEYSAEDPPCKHASNGKLTWHDMPQVSKLSKCWCAVANVSGDTLFCLQMCSPEHLCLGLSASWRCYWDYTAALTQAGEVLSVAMCSQIIAAPCDRFLVMSVFRVSVSEHAACIHKILVGISGLPRASAPRLEPFCQVILQQSSLDSGTVSSMRTSHVTKGTQGHPRIFMRYGQRERRKLYCSSM